MRICGFLTCVCLQVYSSASPLRLGPRRVGLAFASDAASRSCDSLSILVVPVVAEPDLRLTFRP